MRTRISSKGQIVLPADLREQDRILPGEEFEVERLQAGEYLLRKVPAPGKGGVVNWLLACPEKGWFRPLSSESTDEL